MEESASLLREIKVGDVSRAMLYLGRLGTALMRAAHQHLDLLEDATTGSRIEVRLVRLASR